MFTLLLSVAALAAGGACPDLAVPGDAWPTAEPADPAARAALDAWAFPPDLDRADPERRGVRTDGLVVVHHGRIVYERYGGGYGPDTRHLAWSMSKSFTSVLEGIAEAEGRLDPDASICALLDVFDRDAFRVVFDHDACRIRVRDLQSMASGLDWLETYEGHSPVESSVLAMLYGEGHADMATFVLRHPFREAPGGSWLYSSGDANALSAVVGKALAPAHGDRYPWEVLFEPLGMSSATWQRDARGTYVGSSYLYATPRDFARFGLLLLHDGCWGERRLLPEGWIARATAVSDAFRARPLAYDGGPVQGWMFWVNRPVPEQGIDLPWPHVPEGSFAALGHWKQAIYVVPEADLVVVRTGDDRDGESYDADALLERVLDLVDAEVAEPPPPPAPVAPVSPGDWDRRYANGLFELASGYAAMQACACRFVMERDDAFCREWVRVSPDVARYRVDEASRTVTARSLGMGRQVARFVDAQVGCVLEPR